MTSMRKIAALPVAALLAFGLAGCGDSDNANSTATSAAGTAAVAEDGVDAAQGALRAARKAHPNSTVMGVERNEEDHRWEVTLLNPSKQLVEVQVDYNGKVLNPKAEVETPEGDDQQILNLLNDVKLADLSKVIAGNAQEDGVFDSAELDNQDGTVVWKLEFDDKNTGKTLLTVWADAATGDVLASEQSR